MKTLAAGFDFSSLFPPDVSYVWGDKCASVSALTPRERALLGDRATEKRVRDFTFGRHCARAALNGLAMMGQISANELAGEAGMPEILRGQGRAPLWPKGIVGAITHTGEYAAAAVASSVRYLGVGLDLERLGRGSPRLAHRILRPEELEMLRAAPEAERNGHMTAIFSAKESIYKALYPATGVYLGFQDAAVELLEPRGAREGSFSWTLQLDCTPALKKGFRGQGRVSQQDNLVLTAVWVTVEEMT